MTNPRTTLANTLLEIGDQNEKLVTVSCDSALGSGLGPFSKKYPHRHVEVGISEQAGVDIAAGLAVSGFIPFLSVIAPFLGMRAYEQIRNDVGYANTNVKLNASSSGLSYATSGSSHQANEDIALMRTVPNMVILNPGDCYEVEMSLKKAVEYVGPVYIRMPRHPMEDLLPRETRDFQIGKAEDIYQGKTLVIASGTMAAEAKKAVEQLRGEGASCGLINVPCIWPLDGDLILKSAQSATRIVTVEEHSTIGGLGDAVLELLCTNMKATPQVTKIGIAPGAANTGPYRALLEDYGLTHDKLYVSIKAIVG